MHGPNAKRYEEGKVRRAAFLARLEAGDSILEACEAIGWSKSNYHKTRQRWPDWGAAADAALGQHPNPINRSRLVDKHRRGKIAEPPNWDGTFGSFRRVYLGRTSPWFHLRAAKMIEEVIANGYRRAGLPVNSMLKPGQQLSFGGQVLMLLWPPEHGKTAFWEDFDTYALCRWPWFRITVGSEKQNHSQKVVGFVRDRLADDADGLQELRSRFGPFAPRRGRGSNMQQQPWGRTFFNVAKKPAGGQRDYSMAAIGMGGSIIGTRADLLQVDDPQSRKSLGQTESLVETFRQDWLSRPGVDGFTVVLMNRVGENDFPTALMDAGLVDHTITVPVWTEQHGWAWPEKYSQEDYHRIRRNVGADAWERNYMQRGVIESQRSFPTALLDSLRNPLRSVIHPPPRPPAGGEASVSIGVDPGYGTTAISVAALEPTKFRILRAVAEHGLTRPEQMYLMLEDQLEAYTVAGRCHVDLVVVETKAFQLGFINDDRFLELRRRFGFEVQPHMTGDEKNDEDIGIPQMAMSMRREEIDVPDADEPSRREFDGWRKEFMAWRPRVTGNKLRQDHVMATWFIWLYWRRQRRQLQTNPAQFNFRGVPSA